MEFHGLHGQNLLSPSVHSMEFHGIPWTLTCTHLCLYSQPSMEFRGTLWKSMEVQGILWNSHILGHQSQLQVHQKCKHADHYYLLIVIVILLILILIHILLFTDPCCIPSFLPFNDLLSVIKEHSMQEPIKVSSCHPLEDLFKTSKPSIQLLTCLSIIY